MELKLVAGNPAETKVLNYLVNNVSETLAAKINAGEKTLAGAMKHAKDEAEKIEHDGGCVCVEDEVVYGWVIHYFEEDSITEAKPKPKMVMPKGVKVKPEPAKPVAPVQPQMNLFEEITGGSKDAVPESEEGRSEDPF